MRVIKPSLVSDTNLTSSTIPEPDASKGEIEWFAATYATGVRRIKSSTHRIYEVVADPSTTDDPEVGILKDPPTWVDVGPTNKFAMFDNSNSTSSIDNLNLDVTLTPTLLTNSIAGFNIIGAASINVKVNDGFSDIYDTDINMRDNSARVNWYQFFFSPVVAITRFILTDLPPVIGKDIIVSVVGGGEISFGNMVVGSYLDLGTTLYGSGWQGLDFSVREPDGFGGFKITKRRTADIMDYDCFLPRERFSYVKSVLKSLSQVETVWIGNFLDINDGTAVFGYHNDSQINISTPTVIDMTIQVQELV